MMEGVLNVGIVVSRRKRAGAGSLLYIKKIKKKMKEEKLKKHGVSLRTECKYIVLPSL